MEREKLLKEYQATLESLVEKTKFVYSEEFYSLDEIEKHKYTKDKLATEGHLGTLCNVLWGKTQFSMGGMSDLFALGIIGSMFGGSSFSGTPLPPIDNKDFIQAKQEKDENAK